jgi:hypothetical protein
MNQFPWLGLKINQPAIAYVNGQRFIAVAQKPAKKGEKITILILDKLACRVSSLQVSDQPVRMALSSGDGMLLVYDAKGQLRGYDLEEGMIESVPNRAFRLNNITGSHVFGVSQDKAILAIGTGNIVQLYRVEADCVPISTQQLVMESEVLKIEFEAEGVRVFAANHFAYFCVAAAK